MKLKILIIAGLLLSIKSLQAQTDFRSGYIIKNLKDTLFGEIDYRGDLLMSSNCTFKDEENTIKEYSPYDIVAFRFIDSKYYVSKKIGTENVFLEYLIKGQINVYFKRDDNGDHFYLDKENVELTEIPYEEGIKYIDDKRIYFESTKHIGLLTYFMQDAPKLQSQIQSLQKPGRKELIKLAEDYHNAVCDGEQCIIYEKSTHFIKILPELIGGVINSAIVEDPNPDVKNFSDKFYFQGGLIGHVWMPRANEKLYFRTGILFSRLDIDGTLESFYKIPVQLEYIYPKGIVRPRISYGLNYYLPRYQTVSLDIGTNIQLAQTLFLSATTDIEFNPRVLLLPKSFFSYSIKLGLFINLK